jgi:outer membrane protein
MKKLTRIALSVAAVTLACSAFAQKQGDNVLGLGVAFINPSTSVGPLTSSESHVAGLLTNATASISKENTISIGWLHMYTDEIGVEATIGVPPKHKLDFNIPALAPANSHPGAMSVKTWTPTVVGKYFLNTPQDELRPYLGLGVSRVSFHAPTLIDQTLAGVAGTSINMSASWAPVYNFGAIYKIDDRWSINGSVSYLPIKTHATFSGPGVGAGAATTQGDIKVNTTDYVIRVGYKF